MLGKIGYLNLNSKRVAITVTELTEDYAGYPIMLGVVLDTKQRVQFSPASFYIGQRTSDK